MFFSYHSPILYQRFLNRQFKFTGCLGDYTFPPQSFKALINHEFIYDFSAG